MKTATTEEPALGTYFQHPNALGHKTKRMTVEYNKTYRYCRLKPIRN